VTFLCGGAGYRAFPGGREQDEGGDGQGRSRQEGQGGEIPPDSTTDFIGFDHIFHRYLGGMNAVEVQLSDDTGITHSVDGC